MVHLDVVPLGEGKPVSPEPLHVKDGDGEVDKLGLEVYDGHTPKAHVRNAIEYLKIFAKVLEKK